MNDPVVAPAIRVELDAAVARVVSDVPVLSVQLLTGWTTYSNMVLNLTGSDLLIA